MGEHADELLLVFCCVIQWWECCWNIDVFNTPDPEKMAEDVFKFMLLNWNCFDFDSYFTDVCANWWSISISSDNGMAPYRLQSIIWVDDGQVYWRIQMWLYIDELKLVLGFSCYLPVMIFCLYQVYRRTFVMVWSLWCSNCFTKIVSQKTPHTSPSQVTYGVFIVKIFQTKLTVL